ncbi:MAG: cytochrome P450 [Actinobacteria bacterium]|nr:cytochrome P450 [Actinomycetota bacterium]
MSQRTRPFAPTELGLPGPTGLDMARSFRDIRADPVAFLSGTAHRYGDLVAFPVPGPPVLLVNEPAQVTAILQTGARAWTKDTTQYRALRRVTGPGLLATAEPDWLQHRRLATPAFHRDRLAALSARVRALIARDAALMLNRQGAAVIDVAPVMDRISLTAMGTTLFSDDFEKLAPTLLTASRAASGAVVALGRSILPGARWLPSPTNARLLRARRSLAAASRSLVASRRRHSPRPNDAGDLLGLLLASSLNDEQVHSEIVTMMIAGHETVGAAMAWTLMLLAEHQSVQDAVRREANLGDASLSGSHSHLPLTRAVIDEALRLYPSAWVLSRRATQATRLADLDVPAGTQVIISPWLLHRHPAHWSDPETFRPDRFLDAPGRRASYLPFGQGPRLCIGREMTLGQMAIALQVILATHHVGLPQPWTRPRPEALVTIHPRGGMPLTLTHR